MQFDWKPALLVLITAVVTLGTGCSGINSTQSVSPATFFLPGFFGEVPAVAPSRPAAPLPQPEPAQVIAQSN